MLRAAPLARPPADRGADGARGAGCAPWRGVRRRRRSGARHPARRWLSRHVLRSVHGRLSLGLGRSRESGDTGRAVQRSGLRGGDARRLLCAEQLRYLLLHELPAHEHVLGVLHRAVRQALAILRARLPGPAFGAARRGHAGMALGQGRSEQRTAAAADHASSRSAGMRRGAGSRWTRPRRCAHARRRRSQPRRRQTR